MHLFKYRVNKFRSIKGTDWIEIDQSTCFVGLNEAGKTNLLLALWKFNPSDNAIKIDLLEDYPKDEYSKNMLTNNAIKKAPFIEVLFKIDQEERNGFDDFANKYNAYIESLPKEKTKSKEKIKTSNPLLIKKDYNGHFYIYFADENGEELTDDLKNIDGGELLNRVYQGMPKFVYYSEYGNLDSDLYLPNVKEDLAHIDDLTGEDRINARTLKIFFKYLDLAPEEIIALGQKSNSSGEKKSGVITKVESRNRRERYASIKSAATHLSEQFNDWWSQGNYTFHFNTDGEYFWISVSDNEHPFEIELELRSQALQWLFSFFLVFLAESEGAHRNCILLLDEPGLHLHPNAQTDLVKFFNHLSEKNQLIYTTHLPFLVDHNNLDRVRAVYMEKGLTKVSNDLNKEKGAIQPVYAALGITVSQSLLLGHTIVIVEGITDQMYLNLIKNHLISKGKFKPPKELLFMPADGTKKAKLMISIIYGSTNELPISLLDSDKLGKQLQNSLKQELYNRDTGKIIETDTFTGKKGSEIEDLMPLDILIDSFNHLLQSDKKLTVSDIERTDPIVPQLGKFTEKNGAKLEGKEKFELCKRIKENFKGEVDKDLEEKWKDLFDKFL